MRKVIAAINMTLDGYCDHTLINPDAELHQHYAGLLKGTDTILYGRITYQLMEYWRTVLAEPTGEQATDDFAVEMNRIHKVVFSRTLDYVDWETATLAKRSLKEEVAHLKQQPGTYIYVGSPSLIVQLTELGLIDEYQICVHPVIAGNGLPLYKNITERVDLKFVDTKVIGYGAVILYYERG